MTIELTLGYPQWLFRAIGHPATWFGWLIEAMDERWNRQSRSLAIRRVAGIGALVLLASAAGLAGLAVQLAAGPGYGLVIVALAASSLIAQRSLDEHVSAVAQALRTDGIAAGRAAVSRIVGRDPESLDEPAVCRAAIESLAENFSDGVVAPLFWLAVGGLPAAAIYKAVNTADSMIGHKTERHQAFGWASARFDDLINVPASRLSALLLVAASAFVPGASPARAASAVGRDAGRHRSPNAGWPEAAMAGALGLALAGPRRYGGVLVDDATMGEGGRREATPADIRRALVMYRVADGLLLALLAVLALMLHA